MAEEIESLITDEHRAHIGVKGEPTTIVVSEEDAHRMRDAMGDTDPRWADGTGMAPPYVVCVLNRTAPLRAVRILPSGLMTQQEWRFTRPFRIGETLRAVSQVVDIRDRLGGRYGYSVLVTTSTEFSDEEGKPVAAVLVTGTQFDPKGRAGAGSE
jgi:hypothetical protein